MRQFLLPHAFVTVLATWAAIAVPAPTNLRVVSPVFVSPNGSATNLGTLESPWSLNHALSKVVPSGSVMLLPGTYPSIVIRTPGITLASYGKWTAIVRGSPAMHGITIDAPNVVVDGLQVSHSYLDGIKINSSGVTIQNCWVHHAGFGHPNAKPNSDESFSGQGIYSGAYISNTIACNLIEYNGRWNRYDHGVYISGTNHVIRGNVMRYNWAYGLQLYTSTPGKSCSGIKVYNNLIYGNGVYSGGRNCVTVWAGPPGVGATTTNFIFSNTMICEKYYAVVCDYGFLALTNNIILSGYDGSVIAADGGTVWCDSNLLTNALHVGHGVVDGGRNVIVNSPGFVSPTRGLFWLTSMSPARGAANRNRMPPFDFFGTAQTICSDVGAFQFDDFLATDGRALDPAVGLPDYWRLE